MSDAPVLLSVKEIGYFASKLLTVAHCPAGALPELARVVSAQDILLRGALESLMAYVETGQPVDPTLRPSDSEPGDYLAGPESPAFAVLPWAAGLVIARAARDGIASTAVRLATPEPLFLEGLLASRSVPTGALVVVHGTSCVASIQDRLFVSNTPDHRLFLDAVGAPNRQFPGADEVLLVASARIPTADLLEAGGFTPVLDLADRRKELYETGRYIEPEAWGRMKRVVSRTLVASSEKSRLGAG